MADVTQSPGWYPDPDGGAGQRWWNGAGWSDSRRGGAAAPATTQAPSVPLTPSIIYSAENPPPRRPGEGEAEVPVTPARTVNLRVNQNASIGFVLGVISMFFNFFFLLGIVAIAFSAAGVVKARQLRAEGATSTLMNLALIGVALGVLSTVIAVVTIVVWIVGSVSVNVS